MKSQKRGFEVFIVILRYVPPCNACAVTYKFIARFCFSNCFSLLMIAPYSKFVESAMEDAIVIFGPVTECLVILAAEHSNI